MDAQRFVEIFRLAALQAGQVARYLQGHVTPESKVGERTPEAQALTAVDLAAQDVILHQLLAAAPHVAIDTEESTPLVERFRDAASTAPLLVIDPIDGTLNYIRGSKDYAVMGALVVEGIYRASVVAFPAYGELFWAIRGEGCWVERATGPARSVSAAEPRSNSVLVSPRVSGELRQRLAPGFDEVVVSRCSAVDASVIALARARAAVSEGRSDRRRAIGYLLSTEAGGVVLHGDQVWQGEDPERLPPSLSPSIVAANEAEARHVLKLASRR